MSTAPALPRPPLALDPNALTQRVDFSPCNFGDRELFCVVPGRRAADAAALASNCLETIRTLLADAHGDGSMAAANLFSCLVLAEVADASLRSIGVQP